MIPYSMPLWTILTKWPAPFGPPWRYPRPGVSADGPAPGRGGEVAGAGSQPREDRIEVLDHRGLAADHQAVPSLSSPDPAAGAHVHVGDAPRGERPRAPGGGR